MEQVNYPPEVPGGLEYTMKVKLDQSVEPEDKDILGSRVVASAFFDLILYKGRNISTYGGGFIPGTYRVVAQLTFDDDGWVTGANIVDFTGPKEQELQ